ncbi:laccase Lcc4 [Moelleriella libera RCEF 2490]|uniref:laccase n=1 Tax=Moelleriella libera RCEF 2490 TaxID=1081109 RepID=A0A168AB93_9HYPO|nr:laccase Lcc4 [Moelleriella libera RCEF 2490]
MASFATIRYLLLNFLFLAASAWRPCGGNTPSNRGTWCEHSISTDYENEVVDTGVTREYFFEITDLELSPDGIPRIVKAINGSLPGPTIYANWGDTVVVHVHNSMSTSQNGTAIHWHGIRQNYTNQNDGVPSITQCPVPVGSQTTYRWKAVQYGTTWYHSHIGLQAWEGVFGGIVINGPASANYDKDLGVVFLNDWSHKTFDELYLSAQLNGPPRLDNALINGTNVYTSNGKTTGKRFTVAFEEKKSHRIRLVNGAIDTHFKFSIDNHTMTVIASDLVPIKPYNTTVLNIGMGQRYDIIVTADQAAVAKDFWMRAIPQSSCSDVAGSDNIRGIVHYGKTPGTPNTIGYSYNDDCGDETNNLVPFVSKAASSASETTLQDVTVARNTAGLFRWYLNSTSMQVDWKKPTLLSIINGTTNFEKDDAVFELKKANQWVYFIVQTAIPVPHPIHLHGHDFYVLAQGSGAYSASTPLNLKNPPRRDTAMLPSSGFLVMAWVTDNPGVWLMHCHIGWHTSEGFAVQFIERQNEIPGITSPFYVKDVCHKWDAYQLKHGVVQEDSGV